MPSEGEITASVAPVTVSRTDCSDPLIHAAIVGALADFGIQYMVTGSPD